MSSFRGESVQRETVSCRLGAERRVGRRPVNWWVGEAELQRGIAAAPTGSLWQVDVFWPDAEGLSAGVTHLFYVGRADGLRLWLVY